MRLSGSCDSQTLLNSLQVPEVGMEWMSDVDLSAMTWCEPAGLVGIACFVESQIRAGLYVNVNAPRSRVVSTYLSRMRLGQVLTELGAAHSLPAVNARFVGSLLELRLFNGSRGAERLAKLVDDETRHVDAEVANALWEGIVETGQNVEQHSGNQFGFVAAQVYKKTRGVATRRFLFAVGDSGRGILDTFRPRGASDAAEALRWAVTPGFTETDDPARGSGLSDINGFLRDLGGGLEVISDAGMLSTMPPHRRAHLPGKAPLPRNGCPRPRLSLNEPHAHNR